MKIGDVLIDWYRKNKRDLPWRKTKDPYYIWVSEIIFQQTRIIQGIQYYNRFIERFPNVHSLAKSKIDDVLKVWQGLGYYSRARNMHETAIDISHNKNGMFPGSSKKLLALKGVGLYTAAAIASISFDEKISVVDGNVIRLITRLQGFDLPVSSDQLKKNVADTAFNYMNNHSPGEFNQAMMEYGALQCVSGKPDCSICPLSKKCYAYINNVIEQFPVKLKAKASKNRYFYYGVFIYKNKVFVKKRTDKDIWQGLYDFPMVETNRKISMSSLVETEKFKKVFSENFISCKTIGKPVKRILSHQVIYAQFFELQYKNGFVPTMQNAEQVSVKSLRKLPVPKIIEKFIESKFKN
jgi:A/G-specific adenine glycosylase